MTKERGDDKGPETITASPDLDPAGGSPELGAQTVAGGGREPGAEIEAGNHKLGAGAEAHSCEGDSLREFTGSCKSHQTGAYGFLLLLTEIWIRAGRAADFASRPHFEKSAGRF